MPPERSLAELSKRGFRFFGKKNLWVGPYNVQSSGGLNWDKRAFADSARLEELSIIDEKLRAKRCLPRPNSSGGPGAGLL